MSCQKVYNQDGSVGAGYCDDATAFDRGWQCDVCAEGDVCAFLWPGLVDLLHCVPRAVCEHLLGKGGDGCLFSDKSAFSLALIVEPPTCPVTSHVQLCGGPCGACPDELLCSGRSPTHPLGMCLPRKPGVLYNVPHCAWGTPCKEDALCFIYADDAIHTKLFASQWGMCFPPEACVEAATLLPGGGACLDKKGNVVAGELPQ